MDNGGVNWADHIIGWMGTAVAAVAALMGGALIKLWRHEERIRTLEHHHVNKIAALTDIAKKVDSNHAEMAERVDAMSKEIRADLRVIMTRCLAMKDKD